MALLPIIVAPDPRLKLRCAPVEKVDAGIRRLMTNMLETMYEAPGIGLAAPQVGVTRRVLVVDVAGDGQEPAPICMANPEIVYASELTRLHEEGCLSLPEHFAEVVRPSEVRVRFIDRDNEIREIEADGLLATCVQHEIDHLEGTLFVDHISKLKRDIILRKLSKLKKSQQPAAAAVG